MNARPEHRRRGVEQLLLLRNPSLCFLGASLMLLAAALDRSPSAPRADRVLVVKGQRKLILLSRGQTIKTYKIALGGDPIGAKTRQGDRKTPQGLYILDHRNAHSP